MPFLSSLRHDRRGKIVVFGAKKSVLFRGTSGQARFRLQPAVNSRGMAMTVERISAVTFRVSNIQASVQFYRDVLGMEMLYGGERSRSSSLRAGNADSAILNLELGEAATRWGRLIFYVADVDGAWKHLTDWGFRPERREMTRGESDTSTCATRTATSCRSRGRIDELEVPYWMRAAKNQRVM